VIWRFYPFAILVGLAVGSAVEVVGILGGMVVIGVIHPDAAAIGLDLLERADVRMLTLASSLASSFAAGFVAARFAPGEELVNAGATGVILVVGMARYTQPTLDAPLTGIDMLTLALAVPLAVAGGLLVRGREPSA